MWQTVAVIAGLLVTFTAAITPLETNSWALLVAGSNGYYNYRHQADICHSYHVMINEGIPAEKIIVMMYNDIAYNTDNPTPGVIINKPNGTNVYAGVKIDYTGDDLTPQNFLNILSGNKTSMKGIGTGRDIESDENTNLFVYFADHGGTGMLCFPNDNLMADDLENTLSQMRRKKKYDKFIFYVEACESGSMFDNILPEHTDIFVMTAAARDESSWGWYCDDGTCLGDEFSVRWMEHMDSEKTGTLETFFHQYQHVRTAVTKSHVQVYGDFSLGPEELTPNKKHPTYSETVPGDVVSVSSREAALHYLRHKISKSNDVAEKQKLQNKLDEIVKARKLGDQLFDEFVMAATANSPKVRSLISEEKLGLRKDIFPCYKKLLHRFRTFCFGHENEYFLQHFYKFANICLLSTDVDNLLREMPAICKSHRAAIKVTVV
uniref:legumain n=2 Tax=Lygus hesperus TaxID=30085 RepID=A0A0K8SFZ5_LYGHE